MASDDLLGLDELAAILGVAKITAKRYAARDDFPAPAARLTGRVRVWRRTDVETWAKRTLPLPTGRPRKSEP